MSIKTLLLRKTMKLNKSMKFIPVANYTGTNNSKGPVNEGAILDKLRQRFPDATVTVEDTSGGCGAMFNIYVETKEFTGLNITKQHKLVYETLKEQIGKIHGLHVETKAIK
nr:unnamed protein product [Callosobruchus analis]